MAGRVLALSDSNLEQVPVLRHQPNNTTATGDSAARIYEMLPKPRGMARNQGLKGIGARGMGGWAATSKHFPKINIKELNPFKYEILF